MEGRKSIWVRVIGILTIGLLVPHILMPNLQSFGTVDYKIQMTVSFLVTTLLWEGNLFIILRLQKWLPWERNTLQRLVVQFIISGLYSNLIVSIAIYLVTYEFEILPFKWEMFIYHMGIATILGIMVEALYEGSYFLSEWKKALSKAERLEKENVKAKYEALKNQVNPHFLFNSLNTLANMVMDEENDKAVEFIQKLSKVYRYILQSRDQEISDFRTEMKIVEEYTYLLKNRFEEGVEFHYDVPNDYNHLVLPPLTLQMLIENTVKHNVISSSQPLKVLVQIEDDRLVIKNTLNLKRLDERESTGMGIENIKNRYQLLTDEEVIIKSGKDFFEVRLPLISSVKEDLDESTNNRGRIPRCKKITKNDSKR